MALLETKHLTHVFPDGTQAINDINLRVLSGEFLILAGANGSGKTVFIRHLNGLLTPTKGEVLLDGAPIGKNLALTRRKIGLIFQDSDAQIVGQTVTEDVAFGPENLRLPASEVQKIVQESLEMVGLSHLADKNPHTLSGGQKRKLAVAGVLAMKPDIVIFDEPFTGLDYPGVLQVLHQLVTLHTLGHTILLVTHELEKVLAHADRLAVFHKGTLALCGKPKDIILDVADFGIRVPLANKEEVGLLTWLK